AERFDVSVGQVISVFMDRKEEEEAREELGKKEKRGQEAQKEFRDRVEEEGEKLRRIREQLSEVIVGQEDVVEKVLIAMVSDGNILLEGVPGLGKSLLIEALGKAIG
ncbi:MAG: ATP-binding protein, partial [Candidatus Nanohaloarchaea archaeon]|nr:ATP-binding protein [Candidatus Nanohaloarchaea archaeon]